MLSRWVVCWSVFVAALFSGLLCSDQAAGDEVTLESSALGATQKFSGTSVTEGQFVGWRFQTTESLAVQQVGGHLLSIPDQPGDIFAALVRLQSIDSVPIGVPFNADEVVATTTFRPSFPSDEVLVPLATTLSPGSYVLVFGTGMFGATGEAALPNFDDQPDIPPTDISSFIFWSRPFVGQPLEWRLNLASHMRFVIEAQTIIPGDFNGDGIVNAADYVVWRDGLGSTYTQADFDVWCAQLRKIGRWRCSCIWSRRTRTISSGDLYVADGHPSFETPLGVARFCCEGLPDGRVDFVELEVDGAAGVRMGWMEPSASRMGMLVLLLAVGGGPGSEKVGN